MDEPTAVEGPRISDLYGAIQNALYLLDNGKLDLAREALAAALPPAAEED